MIERSTVSESYLRRVRCHNQVVAEEDVRGCAHADDHSVGVLEDGYAEGSQHCVVLVEEGHLVGVTHDLANSVVRRNSVVLKLGSLALTDREQRCSGMNGPTFRSLLDRSLLIFSNGTRWSSMMVRHSIGKSSGCLPLGTGLFGMTAGHLVYLNIGQLCERQEPITTRLTHLNSIP